MRTTVPSLDGALVRVSALEYPPPVPYVNHGPMACEALATLGFEASLDEWVLAFESALEAAAPAEAPDWGAEFGWQDALGDRRLLPQWLGYFERAVGHDGWSTVVATWVPRLMPGLAAALFHGVIRTSHAVRAIDAADTGPRREELARALATWAAWFQPGHEAVAGTSPLGPRHSAPEAAALIAASAARSYVAAPTIVRLHGVTGAMAVELLVPHLAEADADAAVHQLGAEHGTPSASPLHRSADEDAGQWDLGVETAAARSLDPHQIKLVEACRRGLAATGDGWFVDAARTVTRSTAR
jgi:hypothetical protein